MLRVNVQGTQSSPLEFVAPAPFPMPPVYAALALAVTAAAAAPPIPRGGPPPTRGLSGVDDQGIPDMLYATDRAALAARYASMGARLAPGNRRYNLFWMNFEDAGAPTAAPRECAPTHVAVPTNESDRAARGYHAFHCYSRAALESTGALIALDASIGSVSTAIVYAAPDWAVDSNCTGFPWPPNPNFRAGCLPWDAMDAWEDYINLLSENWPALGFCIWNEIQSMGWADPSPRLPNRFTSAPFWTPAQLAVYVDAIAQLFERAARASARHAAGGVPAMLWLSTDHFTLAPPLARGDVGHIGLYEFLDTFWPRVADWSFAWGVAVHPYDAGDPRQDLSARGIYTFATLARLVADVQCDHLVALGAARADCARYPQTQMWASEQGWPQGPGMNKTLQARNICYAHGLSLAQGLWSVTHNTLQSAQPSSQGGSGDFSLLDEPPLCDARLEACDGRETFDAYASLPRGIWNATRGHYCCARWGWGCAAP